MASTNFSYDNIKCVSFSLDPGVDKSFLNILRVDRLKYEGFLFNGAQRKSSFVCAVT